ncbi:MAG: DNA-protecting protein DprA [Bacteroidales bacterium]|nr:DNA-protecting protein DprA [Bacteroidales bacterium]
MPVTSDERAAWCALNLVFGFEPRIGHALVDAVGDALAIFSLKERQMQELGLPERFRPQLGRSAVEAAAASLEELARQGRRFIAWTEEDYPSLLRECEDPPLGLYCRSDDPPGTLFDPDRPAIGIVGTRNISPYGNEWCQRIVTALARTASKPLIVSGLALGVDGVAHRTALDCGLPTIGIMATGIETVYPWRHNALAERMAATPGSALLTDYPPGTAPVATHFLRRNRIIAGICSATILVESKIRGGGMMTARLAASYDRTVLALPGRIDDLRSQGCNLLIRQQIAEPITDLDELPVQLGLAGRRGRRTVQDPSEEVRQTYAGVLPPEQVQRLVAIVGLIRRQRGISLEEIARATGRPWPEVSADAGILESDGIISTDLLQNCTITPKIM